MPKNNPLLDVEMVECYICKAIGRKPSKVLLPKSEAVLIPPRTESDLPIRLRGIDDSKPLYRHRKHNSATLEKFREWQRNQPEKRMDQKQEEPATEHLRRAREFSKEYREFEAAGVVGQAITTLRNFARSIGMEAVIMFQSKERTS